MTFNGKSKWDPPTEKKTNGLFNLGEEPTGVLKFQFTLNPILLKENEKLIKKAKEEGDNKKLNELLRNADKPVETLEVDNVAK